MKDTLHAAFWLLVASVSGLILGIIYGTILTHTADPVWLR